MATRPDRILQQVQLDEAVSQVRWDPWGRAVAAGSLGGELVVVGLGMPEGEIRPSPHDTWVTALAWAPDGSELAVGHASGTLDVGPPAGRARRVGHHGPVGALAWSPDGTALAVAAGAHVDVYDGGGGLIDAFWFLPGSIRALCWAPGPATLAAGGVGGVHWLAVGGEGPPEPVAAFTRPGAVLSLALDHRHRFLAAADLRGTVTVSDLWGDDEYELDGFDDKVRGVAWSPDGTRLVVASDDAVSAWRLDHEGLGGRPEWWIDHHGLVRAARVAPDGTVVCAGDDGRVRVVDLDSGVERAGTDLDVPVRCLDVSRTGALVAAGTADGRVVVLDPTG